MADFPKRTARYAKVAAQAVRVGAGVATSRLTSGAEDGRGREAALIRTALGSLKGPLMKVGQLLASIPDFLPREYAAELATLQSDAPSMGWPFVRRRMTAELGSDWQKKFRQFEPAARFAASLGQVHEAVALDGRKLACKLQYPDMDSVIEADLGQLRLILGLMKRFEGSVSTDEVYAELADRLREELDYAREARNIGLYEKMLADIPTAHVPQTVSELSTNRLLTMTWLEGEKFIDTVSNRSQDARNQIAINMFRVWYTPFYRYGVIHGDPHMGNYTIRPDNSINLLDFGCIRVFKPDIVQAVILVYEALRDNDRDKAAEAYRLWGFENPSRELIDTLNIWARFVYAPLLEDRIFSIEETNATHIGRETAGRMYREIKKLGGVSIPRAFVMIDRASIGLGGVFLRLNAEVNWCRVFNELTEGFDFQSVAERQKKVLPVS